MQTLHLLHELLNFYFIHLLRNLTSLSELYDPWHITKMQRLAGSALVHSDSSVTRLLKSVIDKTLTPGQSCSRSKAHFNKFRLFQNSASRSLSTSSVGGLQIETRSSSASISLGTLSSDEDGDKKSSSGMTCYIVWQLLTT